MSVKEKLSLSCNKTLKALFNEFPGLGIQEAKRIDKSIKRIYQKAPPVTRSSRRISTKSLKFTMMILSQNAQDWLILTKKTVGEIS